MIPSLCTSWSVGWDICPSPHEHSQLTQCPLVVVSNCQQNDKNHCVVFCGKWTKFRLNSLFATFKHIRNNTWLTSLLMSVFLLPSLDLWIASTQARHTTDHLDLQLQMRWQQRNQSLLHQSHVARSKQHTLQNGKTDEEQMKSAEVVRHFFTEPHLLTAQDRHYCNGALLQWMRQRPSHWQRWFTRVRWARAALLPNQEQCISHSSAGFQSYWHFKGHARTGKSNNHKIPPLHRIQDKVLSKNPTWHISSQGNCPTRKKPSIIHLSRSYLTKPGPVSKHHYESDKACSYPV